MKIIFLAIAILLNSCFTGRQKGDYEIGTAQLYSIRKVEIGFELTWIDSRGVPYLVSVTDTAGLRYKTGMIITSLIKK